MRRTQVGFQIEDFDLELEVTASISPGFPGRGPSMAHAGGEPPEPAEVEDLYVGVIIGGVSIEITDKLPKKVRQRIEALCFEKAEEQEDDARDAAADARFEEMRDEKLGRVKS
jgi:hypothetical protein